MSAIPFEILTLTFKLLSWNDQIQCMSVCKSWNQASAKILYSHIKLDSEKKCQLYVRTIKRSRHLGKHLKVIEAKVIDYGQYVHTEKRICKLWEKYDLLNTVIKHCPNVLEMLNSSPSSTFLIRLTKAGLQNRLSCLQYVASPKIDDFYLYADTVLTFKKTLTTLELPNGVPQDIYGPEIHPFLYGNLDQFPCLRTLEIKCHYKYFLSHYDTLINNCKNLTTLIIHPKPDNDVFIPINFIKTFRQHRKIETLECTFPIVNTEDQIAYIMQKFPNLTSLTIKDGSYIDSNVVRFSMNTLIKFLGYISSLKKGVISVHLNLKDCINPWVSVINKNISTIDIGITTYGFPMRHNSKVSAHFTGKTLSLTFPSYTDHHIEFLSKIGRKVRSLALDLIMSSPAIEANIDQVIELIKLCPSLQHLKFPSPRISYLSGSTGYQNFDVKSLSINYYYPYFKSLEKMSFIFPNMKNLHLIIISQCYISHTITIYMPYSCFDILTCSLDLGIMSEREIYIRLKTDAGLQFYSSTKNKLQKINEDEHKQLDLDIICRSLTKLQIETFKYNGNINDIMFQHII